MGRHLKPRKSMALSTFPSWQGGSGLHTPWYYQYWSGVEFSWLRSRSNLLFCSERQVVPGSALPVYSQMLESRNNCARDSWLFSVFSQLRAEYKIGFLWTTSFNQFNCFYSPPNKLWWYLLGRKNQTADYPGPICACSWLLKWPGYLIPNGGFIYSKVSNSCMLSYWFLRQSGSQQYSQAPSEICFMRNAKSTCISFSVMQ